jgi:ABC-type phosphate transport system ATPase subunit
VSHYVELSNLMKIYPTANGPAIIVQDFDLRIGNGEFVALIGHSGCGKSTVLSMLAGLTDLSGGGIILAGKELAGPGPDRGIVFQSPCLLPWMTAFENVMLGVEQVFYTASKEERRGIVQYYLTVVGLADAMNKRPAELSQGMSRAGPGDQRKRQGGALHAHVRRGRRVPEGEGHAGLPDPDDGRGKRRSDRPAFPRGVGSSWNSRLISTKFNVIVQV